MLANFTTLDNIKLGEIKPLRQYMAWFSIPLLTILDLHLAIVMHMMYNRLQQDPFWTTC